MTKVLPAILPLAALAAPPPLAAGPAPAYNRDIRPVLSENCFACHGPDANTREADLRLDVREDAVAAGAVVPGDPSGSPLVARITTRDPDDVMPPPESHKELTPDEVGLLRSWVAAGAAYEEHWAFIPPVRPPVPGPAGPNPVDSFARAALAERGLDLSPEAPAQVLARRLHLDLNGVPPAPGEARSFDPERAAERIADLLDRPAFGERFAVPYLDGVRFADTVGYHGDQNQRVFPYRDYVIRSFNSNKPYDRFITEQIAGDLIEGAGDEQRVATGFNRLNMVTREGGAQPKEYLAKYQADRVRTVSTAFLGITMGCAECHDHKFDPFTSRDFYSLAAYFADVRQWGVYADYRYTPEPELRGVNNDWPFPPEIEVASPYLARRIAKLWDEIDEAAARPSWSASELGETRGRIAAFTARHPDGWAPAEFTTPVAASGGTRVTAGENGAVRFAGKPSKGESFTVELAAESGGLPVAAVRLELLRNPAGGGKTVRGDAARLGVNLTAGGAGFLFAEADRSGPVGYRNGSPVPVATGGWRSAAGDTSDPVTLTYYRKRPAETRGKPLVLTLASDEVAAVRFSVSPLPGAGSRPGSPADSPAATVLALASPAVPDGDGLLDEIDALRLQVAECNRGRASTMVTESVPDPLVTRVLPRGNWQDHSGEVVGPAPPASLATSGDQASRDRRDLARWITSSDNPLTARHFVNRLWAQLFGHGLSRNLDDLGNQGEWPDHPELLDWLAVEFMESGWDVKHLVALIASSKTYRQSSHRPPQLERLDPGNRLLSSQNPRRLEAEFVRDNALAIAGLLDPEVGGPSGRPYQPAGYYAHLNFPTRRYEPHLDDRQFRRGVYTHWQRTFLHPMLANFDAPSREECTASRTVSNTPQQALTLLNDPTFTEAARAFGARLASGGGGFDSTLDRAFWRALARPPSPEEHASLRRFYDRQLARFQDDPAAADALATAGFSPVPQAGDRAKSAAWTQVARVLLNLHETITRF